MWGSAQLAGKSPEIRDCGFESRRATLNPTTEVKMMTDQEEGPVTRGHIERYIWAMTGWQGTAQQMDELLKLVDTYAELRSPAPDYDWKALGLEFIRLVYALEQRGDLTPGKLRRLGELAEVFGQPFAGITWMKRAADAGDQLARDWLADLGDGQAYTDPHAQLAVTRGDGDGSRPLTELDGDLTERFGPVPERVLRQAREAFGAPHVSTTSLAEQRRIAAAQLRGFYDLIREDRLPANAWRRIAELTELLEGEEAAVAYWRYARGEAELPGSLKCRACRVPLPPDRFNKDRSATGRRSTCRRCENARDRAHKRNKETGK